MNSIFDKLKLSPQERRLVMLAMVVLFLVVNFWLVIPHFGDWKVLRGKLKAARESTSLRTTENAKLPTYKQQLDQLQEQGGQSIQPGDMASSLMENISREAMAANISIAKLSPGGGGSIPNNPFFEEQRVVLNGTAAEADLVNFLRRLGTGPALLRVRDMDLKPDASGIRLAVTLTIVGNYLKSPTAKPKTGVRTTSSAPAPAAPKGPAPKS